MAWRRRAASRCALMGSEAVGIFFARSHCGHSRARPICSSSGASRARLLRRLVLHADACSSWLITSVSRFLVSEPLSARHEGPGIGSVSGFSISGCPGESEETNKVIMSVYCCVVHESQTFRIWKRTQSRCIMASYTSAKPSVFGNNLNHDESWRCTYQPNLPYLETI